MDETGYELTRILLQRGLGLMYLVAFLVVVNQFRPLCGERGLLPAPNFLHRVHFRAVPSLFHLFPTDRAFGIGGWEAILLETGFLAIFLGGAGVATPAVTIWLLRWVLFRVMFGAGLIKLRGDPCWHDLSCLDYHFETQPLPNPLSRLFHRLPRPMLRSGVLFNHLVEVAVPFAFFAPQPICAIAGLITIAFQGTLIVSGNFAWLNHLTIVLAFSTLPDGILEALLPFAAPSPGEISPLLMMATWGLAALVAVLSIAPVRNLFSKQQAMNTSYNPYHLVNTYGAFGSITRTRYEIVIEGSQGETPSEGDWRAYEFRAKPGDVRRRPPQIGPYHLRLDWLMWFAAMSTRNCPLWFLRLLGKLLTGDAATLALLGSNPFPGEPPRYVRALYYRYRFCTATERRKSGCWWHRELQGLYFPPVSRNTPLLRELIQEFIR